MPSRSCWNGRNVLLNLSREVCCPFKKYPPGGVKPLSSCKIDTTSRMIILKINLSITFTAKIDFSRPINVFLVISNFIKVGY